MINSVEEMQALVEKELREMLPQVRDALRPMLIMPVKQQREWFTGGEPIYPCWLMMESDKYDMGIAYSEFGFGPTSPWGLVSLSELVMGVDSSWFGTLERAFCDSIAADFDALKVWAVYRYKNLETYEREMIESGLTYDEAETKAKQLGSSLFVADFYR